MNPALLRTGFWLALAVTLLVATLPQPIKVQPSDKVQHFAAFVALTLLGRAAHPRARLWLLAADLAAYGALIELLQGTPVVDRNMDPWDWLADCLGILVALPVARFMARRGS